MKKETHPTYQDVLFVDSSTGYKFVCGTTLQPKQKETYEGKEYPVYHVSVSSSSHPFFTGSNQFIDTEGRVDKFLKRYAAKTPPAPKEEQEQGEGKKKEEKSAPKKKKK
jgi:large subunit ribosomal protein L31